MPDERTLNKEEEKLAKAYKKSGKLPSDPEEARIVDSLVTEGVLEAKPQEPTPDESE